MALEWSETGVLQVSVDGDMGRFRSATRNRHVNAGLVSQIASLGSYGQRKDDAASNFALGFVDSMQGVSTTPALQVFARTASSGKADAASPADLGGSGG